MDYDTNRYQGYAGTTLVRIAYLTFDMNSIMVNAAMRIFIVCLNLL